MKNNERYLTMKKQTINNILLTTFLLSAATALSFFFFHFTERNITNITIFYTLALILISRYTTGYYYGVFSALFSVACVNFLFTYPFYQLDFTLTGYPITFAGMLTITLVTTAATSRIKKQAAIIAEREKAIEEAEREKIRANLLRAISHDLRTPLTGIIGASSSYLEAENLLSDADKRELVTNINNDSNWLLNMVENLLSVTRIQGDNRNLNKTPEAIEEVVSEATMRLHKRLPSAVIHVTAPEEFLMIPMDALLIEQVLLNLLENAITHSGSQEPTDLIITEQEDVVTFQVKDYGKGLDETQIDKLFKGAYSSATTTDSHRGMGIGLSICKTIINAHGGTILARNHEHGAEFIFTLPKES